MKRKWKVLLGLVVLLLVGGGTYASVQYQKRGVVTVQTGKVSRQDLAAVVTASGEIKPRNYINISADAQGRITDILVKEGDRVRRKQVLARIEAIQAAADVQAQRATLGSTEADSAAAEASLRASDDNIAVAQATIQRTQADLARTKTDADLAAQLYRDKLVSRQETEQKKALYDAQAAAVQEAITRLNQARSQKLQTAAQLSAAQRRIAQARANVSRAADALDKHNAISPIDGVVTNLPVRVGETVVPGIQNSSASTLMTIADTSVITAEVKVDETDIVNVKLNQLADVTVDAIPGRTFKGNVIEIGNTAILRSTGLAASQSAISSQEAKDFKVVVALDNPPDELRPGLSCTAKIVTATRKNAVTIPIQALTVRSKADLDAKPGQPPAPVGNSAAEKAKKEEIQGVFVIAGEKATFHKVTTGITGATDIEVTDGLKDGEEILTGSYKVIRTLRNDTKVKVDNKVPVVKTES